MRVNELAFKAGGEAGSGIATIGSIFAKVMQRSGLHVFMTNDYPSLIRGGHNTITIRASGEDIYALDGQVDLLVALDLQTIRLHAGEMASGGVVLYDSTRIKEENAKAVKGDARLIGVPMTQIARDCGGEIMFNQVAVGACLAMLGMDTAILDSLIAKSFNRKGQKVVDDNIKAAEGGFGFIRSLPEHAMEVKIQPRKNRERNLLIGGNDAVCLGAVAAGVRLVAEYPMSPSSSVLHWMAAHALKHDIVVKHTEDEIAAVNWLCGAGFAGVRAMTATSGGGFSLMAEGLGNAGIAEIPIVIIEDQRCGPSTGLPTYTEQADLRFALHASQGEFERIVAMPGDAQEAFHMTFDVFNMADKAQMPAIILMDKYVGEAARTIPYIDTGSLKIDRGLLQSDEKMEGAKGFKRHAISEDGLSARCLPGQKNGIHVCSSYEHDETGFTSEEAPMRIAQIDKRARKIAAIEPALYQPAFYGDPKSTFLLVSWGSTKGPALEALKLLEKANVRVRYMHIRYASPFAADAIKHALQAASDVLICEGNSTGQMRALIREKTGIQIPNAYLRYDGRPFEPADIAEMARKILKD